jgi:maleate isomerase
MANALGFRKKIGVVTLSTNTIVQPELDAMRPYGVTNHMSRIFIRDRLIKNDENSLTLMDDIRAGLMEAIDVAMTAGPDHLILGVSAESFSEGLEGSKQLQASLQQRAGVEVTLASDACHAALRNFGGVKRLGVITPYRPISDILVARFFIECGYDVVIVKGLKCESPLRAANVSERELRDAIDEVNDPTIQAIVQVGNNLAMTRLAASAELWLDMPVIAVNTASYWWALRRSGIDDKVHGFGSLLEAF